MLEYFIGVDGGGSGTRVRLANADGAALGQGQAGPSALAHGIESAWNAVDTAVAQAFAQAGRPLAARGSVAIGLGLAGVHNKQWAARFLAHNPGYATVALESDAFTTLLGAHRGQAGAIVAIGTGSVGEVLEADGRRREVGGWGFPAGDEAGGAWIGMRAIGHVQQVVDGRAAPSLFAAAVIAACVAGPRDGGDHAPQPAPEDGRYEQQHGPDGGATRDALQRWLSGANQTVYAQLARLVIAHGATDGVAREILTDAGHQVALIADALDPGAQLPLALCGGLAAPLAPYLPAALLRRVVAAHGDSAAGALHLIERSVLEQAQAPARRAEPAPC